MDDFKNIKVSPKNHKRLMDLKQQHKAATGYTISVDQVIGKIIDIAEGKEQE